MQQTLFCLAAVLAVSAFGLSRERAVVAAEHAEARRATEAAVFATAERWAATLHDAADVGGYRGLDRTETARAALGLVSVRVRIDVRDAAAAGPSPVAVVAVTEVRTDGQTPATASLRVRVTPAGRGLHS